LSRRIDVVGCGNAVRKEGRKEGKRKRIDVGCSNAGGEEEEEGVVGWSFTHIMDVAKVCHGSRTLCTMQSAEQQQAVR
jgi:hypothetical protein